MVFLNRWFSCQLETRELSHVSQLSRYLFLYLYVIEHVLWWCSQDMAFYFMKMYRLMLYDGSKAYMDTRGYISMFIWYETWDLLYIDIVMRMKVFSHLMLRRFTIVWWRVYMFKLYNVIVCNCVWMLRWIVYVRSVWDYVGSTESYLSSFSRSYL